MQTKNANLGSEIKQCEKDNKAEIERMQRKIANLENEIKNLKRKIAALDIKSANSRVSDTFLFYYLSCKVD